MEKEAEIVNRQNAPPAAVRSQPLTDGPNHSDCEKEGDSSREFKLRAKISPVCELSYYYKRVKQWHMRKHS